MRQVLSSVCALFSPLIFRVLQGPPSLPAHILWAEASAARKRPRAPKQAGPCDLQPGSGRAGRAGVSLGCLQRAGLPFLAQPRGKVSVQRGCGGGLWRTSEVHSCLEVLETGSETLETSSRPCEEGLLTGSHSAEASACLSPRGALLSPLSDFQQPLETDHPENSVPRGLAMFLLFHRGLSGPQQELRAPSGPGWSVSVPPPPGTSCLDQTLSAGPCLEGGVFPCQQRTRQTSLGLCRGSVTPGSTCWF